MWHLYLWEKVNTKPTHAFVWDEWWRATFVFLLSKDHYFFHIISTMPDSSQMEVSHWIQDVLFHLNIRYTLRDSENKFDLDFNHPSAKGTEWPSFSVVFVLSSLLLLLFFFSGYYLSYILLCCCSFKHYILTLCFLYLLKTFI